jgi:ATPase subunit of ABC transporter with duplicated ATPase domains
VLQVRDLRVEVGGRFVVDGASFTVRAGDKVGLVGRNGAGKTSLLKVLAGEAPSAGGAILRQGGLGYLPQEPKLRAKDSATAVEHILSGRGLDEAVTRLEKLRLRLEEDPSERNVARFARAEDAYLSDGGYAADPEARRIAAGLGLAADRLDLPVAVLSGGERRRVELSRILFAGSDLLLLDEPTNHLDLDAKSWLMGFLRGYRGALLVVSHDIELLDESITRVLHLDGEMFEYRGTYTQYQDSRAKDEVRLAKLAARQEAEIKRLRTLADSMRHSTETRARKAQTLDSRVTRLEREAVTGPTATRRLSLKLPEPPPAGRTVLEVADLTKGYGAAPVFEEVTFDVGRGERLLVLGLNGAGKTSLLRILAGVTESDAGQVTFGHNVSTGYYAQEHEGLVAGRDLRHHILSEAEMGETQVRGLLGMFGLSGDMAFQDVATLSGGEKTKLALAALVAGRHNLLLLDEPTNNLDPPSRDAVAAALSSWGGTMIVVSHDASFVESLAPERVLMMPDGTLDYWSDDLLELVALA